MRNLLAQERQKQVLLKKYGYDIGRARAFILEKSRLKPGRLLEVGTGKGHFTRTLAQKGFSFVSIDLDPQAQKIAREYLRQDRNQKKVRIKVMDAGRLKFSSQSFNAVVSVNFMHHARKPFVCLSEMARVVREKIVIADVNKKGETILERLHQREGKSHPLSKATFSSMRSFLEKKGFDVKTYKAFCQTILVAEKGA